MERVGATGRAELKMVMADSGVNVGTNTGRVNITEATEETPSLVLALKADAEEIKGCGALLAEMPRTEEEACEDTLPWIDEIMAGMEFRLTEKLLLVERDGHGITKDNQKLSSRGRTTTGTTRNNGNENHFDRKNVCTQPRENATLLEPEAKPTKIWQNKKKRYTTRTPR